MVVGGEEAPLVRVGRQVGGRVDLASVVLGVGRVQSVGCEVVVVVVSGGWGEAASLVRYTFDLTAGM